MKRHRVPRAALFIGVVVAAVAWVYESTTVDSAAQTSCPQGLSVTSTLPFDTPASSQAVVNCFAWQTFIALNWNADPTMRGQPDPGQPASSFGTPGDPSTPVWATYRLVDDVYLPGAAQPLAWSQDDSVPPACQSTQAIANGARLPTLRMVSKFGDLIPEQLQATGDILIDQSHNLVQYEERMNWDEYNFVVTNTLYDANNQQTLATSTGLLLPPSDPANKVAGAIEIKAAWRSLDGQPPAVINRYKTVYALTYDPTTNVCQGPFTVGLVGLHIIRKTAAMQQIMWSTFEQVDNVPLNGAQPGPTATYTLYNAACQVPAPCTANATPQATPAPPGTLAPVQVTRVQQLQSDVIGLNQYAQGVITGANASSVWQYYQLINVRWPQNNAPGQPGKGATIPVNLATYGFTSSGSALVSNVSMETYIQNFDCTSCHKDAAIAPSKAASCKPTLASDFSFMFRHADTPDNFRATCTPTPR